MMLKKYILSLVMMSFALNGYCATLNDAKEDYLSGDFQQALSTAQRLSPTDEVYYFLGLVYLKLGDYPKARGYFEDLLARYKNSALYEQGMVKMADTYFFERDFKRAREMYDAIKDRKSAAAFTPLAYLRLAQIASKQGNWDDKKKYLNVIKTKYPKSTEMKYVKVLEKYGDYFTIQVGAFSKKENAATVKRDIERKHETYIEEDTQDEDKIYRVRVGKFKDRGEAQKVADALIDEGYPATIYP